MFKVKLEKELHQDKNEGEEMLKQSDAVQEVKLLMQGEETEDLRIMRGLGTSHTLIAAQDAFGKALELEKLDESFDGKVYTVESIKKLAVAYNLRFLKSTLFTGHLDVQVIAKIKEFAKKTNSEITNFELERRFFILAPESNFQLKATTLQRVQRMRASDPAIFYKIDDDHYKLIHKWGADFSAFRFISGLKWRSYGGLWLVTFLTAMPVISLLLALCVSPKFYYNYTMGFYTIAMLVSVGLAFIRCADTVDNGKVNEDFFSPKKWNSPEKLKYSN